ncbi:unnamed protein product [Clonostachys rosea]|uniref:Uncharacterized protein n=1 Tax=Bionectria ochroleuca TaxID=29856 RepID=A0ABY6UAJ6_BIOOC|nr:unnamed protein product [Clonostachys rosea]
MAAKFQKENPTTHITKVHIVYAALVCFWMTEDIENRVEKICGPSINAEINAGVFIAYFGVYLKVNGKWGDAFKTLKDIGIVPFAFLTPAMMEGSALGGPFLPVQGLSSTHK